MKCPDKAQKILALATPGLKSINNSHIWVPYCILEDHYLKIKETKESKVKTSYSGIWESQSIH